MGVGLWDWTILGAYTGGSFPWIVLVHLGWLWMISNGIWGAHLPALASKFLGKSFSHVVNFFTVLLLL
jgi:hypothetical protein